MTTDMQKSTQEELRRLVQQIENLQEEAGALAQDVSLKFKEAKGLGFDVKVLRQIIKLRKKTPDERREEQDVLEIYMSALNMLPLEEAGLSRPFSVVTEREDANAH